MTAPALLEPYNVKASVDFDTSYLMGFYSNTQDITPRGAQGTAELKARTIFNSEMRKLSPNKSSKTVSSMPKLELHRTGYILLPAWFITINAKGTPYTFLVNGQSGRCTGTAPWSKKKVFSTIALATIASWIAIIALFTKVIFPNIEKLSLDEAERLATGLRLQIIVAAISLLAAFLFSIVIPKFIRLSRKLKRTGSVTTQIFAGRRQGGAK